MIIESIMEREDDINDWKIGPTIFEIIILLKVDIKVKQK